ncbi:MAG: cation diffusion facilitator family transporter [Ignavibacteria bacterium]|nr:cation diffusion facilitator family transporter [Ignavibacteria bacterium]
MHNHNHERNIEKLNKAFIFGISLNLLYTAIEFGAGFHFNSLVLMSDAGHNLSDVASLFLSLLAFKLSGISANKRFTFGYKKGTILASLINSILLLVVVGGIIKEAIERLSVPPQAQGLSISVVAFIGIFINAFTAYLFFKEKEKDINVKGAFLHLAIDALVSLGAVVSGIVIHYSGWNIIDPVISMAIAVIIVFSTWSLLKESFALSNDAVPKGIDLEKVKESVMQVDGIADIHHMHVWAISTTENALTMHILLKDSNELFNTEKIKNNVKHILLHLNIQHTTLELEIPGEDCAEPDCTP